MIAVIKTFFSAGVVTNIAMLVGLFIVHNNQQDNKAEIKAEVAEVRTQQAVGHVKMDGIKDDTRKLDSGVHDGVPKSPAVVAAPVAVAPPPTAQEAELKKLTDDLKAMHEDFRKK